MKDTLITARRKKRELWILVACFAAANIVNLGAIIRYDGRWIELVSQLGYVVCFTLLLYLAVGLLRWLVSLMRHKARARC